MVAIIRLTANGTAKRNLSHYAARVRKRRTARITRPAHFRILRNCLPAPIFLSRSSASKARATNGTAKHTPSRRAARGKNVAWHESSVQRAASSRTTTAISRPSANGTRTAGERAATSPQTQSAQPPYSPNIHVCSSCRKRARSNVASNATGRKRFPIAAAASTATTSNRPSSNT